MSYRYESEDGRHTPKPIPEVTFRVDKDWLVTKLQEQWPDIALNVRQPRPQTYLVDFQLIVNGHCLIGGLHRDGYALVLTGREEARYRFAWWYMSLFEPEYSLWVYDWPHDGLLL